MRLEARGRRTPPLNASAASILRDASMQVDRRARMLLRMRAEQSPSKHACRRSADPRFFGSCCSASLCGNLAGIGAQPRLRSTERQRHESKSRDRDDARSLHRDPGSRRSLLRPLDPRSRRFRAVHHRDRVAAAERSAGQDSEAPCAPRHHRGDPAGDRRARVPDRLGIQPDL